MTTETLSDADRREICADHLGHLRALQRRAAATPLAPYLVEIPRCLVLPTDPRCGDPRLTKTTALEVAGAATRAAGHMDLRGSRRYGPGTSESRHARPRDRL